ncbi:GNAT family N-acetyltransferase [Sphingorhabdus lutea]|nr:N-acetyltransferase [Sphingorhabdus lutea]
MTFCPIDKIDSKEIEDLLDQAFGEDRHERTAYKLRDGALMIDNLSFALTDDDILLGILQCWTVQLLDENGASHPLILVGPVGVAAKYQNMGHGRAMLNEMINRADNMDYPPMMLIGDAPYYAPFGFTAAQTGAWALPGPFERARLLCRNVAHVKLPQNGHIAPMAKIAASPR